MTKCKRDAVNESIVAQLAKSAVLLSRLTSLRMQVPPHPAFCLPASLYPCICSLSHASYTCVVYNSSHTVAHCA